MAVDNSTILDRVWLNGTNDYQQRVPNATQQGIAATQAALFAPENLNYYNQFVDALVNRIGSVYVHQQSWDNPLSIFKKDRILYGDKAEEIAVKWIRSHSYADNREDVFKMHRPDANVWFHTVNRREYYPITVNREELEFAFTDEYGLNSFVSSIMQSPRNSDNYDEYRIMLQLLAYYEQNFGFFKQNISWSPKTQASAQELMYELKRYGKMLRFPSSRYNAGLIEDVPVFAKMDELVVLVTPEVSASMDVYALASAFNMEKEEVQQRIIEVDEFPIPNAVALLTTEDFFQCRDKLVMNTSQYNPLTLGTNYFLHHWGMYSVSPFVPAILFVNSVSGTSIPTLTQSVFGINLADAEGNVATQLTAADIVDDIEIQLVPELDATVEDTTGTYVSTKIKPAPDACTYSFASQAYVLVENVTTAVPWDLNNRLVYVDSDSVLHIKKGAIPTQVLVAGTLTDVQLITIIVTATTTYVNPSGATTAFTDDYSVEVNFE